MNEFEQVRILYHDYIKLLSERAMNNGPLFQLKPVNHVFKQTNVSKGQSGFNAISGSWSNYTT